MKMKNKHKYYNEIVAFAEGKTIQARIKEDAWTWFDTPNPQFGDNVYEFRIKPEPKYIPFTFEDREELRGKWIRRKSINDEIVIYNLSKTRVNGFTWDQSLEEFEFLDGSPFGKLKSI